MTYKCLKSTTVSDVVLSPSSSELCRVASLGKTSFRCSRFLPAFVDFGQISIYSTDTLEVPVPIGVLFIFNIGSYQ